MDVLQVAAEIAAIVVVVVPASIWAWRRVKGIVDAQRKEREQMLMEIAVLRDQMVGLEQAVSKARKATTTRFQLLEEAEDERNVARAIHSDYLDTLRDSVGALNESVTHLLDTSAKQATKLDAVQEEVRQLKKGWFPKRDAVQPRRDPRPGGVFAED